MTTYEGWAIVELMGHRTFGGYVSEVEMYGGRLLRLDVYDDEDEDTGAAMTQYYGSSAIYCITPADESMARQVGRRSVPGRPQPAMLSYRPESEDLQDYD